MQKFPQVLRNVRVRDRGAIEANGAFWEEARQIDAELQPDGRVLVRPSGTEPLIRVMVEAPSVERAELVADRLVDLVERTNGGPPQG
jgi:phosphoglucosamine mutase